MLVHFYCDDCFKNKMSFAQKFIWKKMQVEKCILKKKENGISLSPSSPLGLSGPTSPRASPSLPGLRPSQPASAFPSPLSLWWLTGGAHPSGPSSSLGNRPSSSSGNRPCGLAVRPLPTFFPSPRAIAQKRFLKLRFWILKA
jgi:hypothetical protein